MSGPIPAKHWSFKVEWTKINILVVLKNAEEEGMTLVRLRLPARKGVRTYLFVRVNTEDYRTIEHMHHRFFPVSDSLAMDERGVVLQDSVIDPAELPAKWVFTATRNEEDESRLMHMLLEARAWRRRKLRTTVECF